LDYVLDDYGDAAWTFVFFQDPGAEVEYFAFHADHIHEPTPRAKLIFNDRSPLCWQRFKISKKKSLHFGCLHHFPRNHGILLFVVQAFTSFKHFHIFWSSN